MRIIVLMIVCFFTTVFQMGMVQAVPYKTHRKFVVDNSEGISLCPIQSAPIIYAAYRQSKVTTVFLDSSRNQFGMISSLTEPCFMQNDAIMIIIRQYITSSGRLTTFQSDDFGASWVVETDVNAPSINGRFPSCFSSENSYWCSCQTDGSGEAGVMYDDSLFHIEPSDTMVTIFGSLNCHQVLGRQFENGNVIFIAQGNGNVYSTIRNAGLDSLILPPTLIWDSATTQAALVGIDYRLGRFMAMASTPTFSNYQYVISDDNGENGLTANDTIGFNLSGLTDSIITDSRFVIGNEGNPVMILSAIAKAETLNGDWIGFYMYNSIICARADGKHVIIWEPSGNQGGAAYVYLARGQADTLIACWMMCEDVTNFTSNASTNWDLMFAASADGGITWGTPYKMPDVVPGMAECFPHLAVQIGGDRAVHCHFCTNGSFTTNWDLYYDYVTTADGPTTYNYHVAIPIDSINFPSGVLNLDTQNIVGSLELLQSTPNPARDVAAIHFILAKALDYKLDIYDLLGRSVYKFSGRGKTGHNTINWMTKSGGRVTNGIYFYRLTAGKYTAIKMLTIIR
jgi:hypothetical protein